RRGVMDQFREKLLNGMAVNGYSTEFAERVYQQICGFGEYGFPESHAASFALLVYVSAWIKCYHPAVFAAAIINSQPMGFYGQADAFGSLALDRRTALWRALPERDLVSLFANFDGEETPAALPAMAPYDEVRADYHTAGLTLRQHPMSFLRSALEKLRITSAI